MTKTKSENGMIHKELDKAITELGIKYGFKLTNKNCGDPTLGEDDDVLCRDCRNIFGRSLYSEL